MSHNYLDDSISIAAQQLPEHRLAKAKAEFAELDLNQDGRVGLEEFVASAIAKEIKRLLAKFRTADTDRDDSIQFEEFLLVSVPHYGLLKKFAEFDADQDGQLSTSEAANIVDELVIPLEGAELEAEINRVDRDGDGKISYEEFLGVVMHHGMQ